MAFDVSLLNDFTPEAKSPILKKITALGNSAQYFSFEPGVKHTTPVNLLESNPVIQDGFSCISTPSGSTAFDSTRVLTVCRRTAYDAFCLNTLETKYTGELLSAGSDYDATEAIMNIVQDDMADKYARALEDGVWSVAGVNGCGVDGLYQLSDSSNEPSINVIATPRSGSDLNDNIRDEVKKMVKAIPTEVKDRQDLTIFMSVELLYDYLDAVNENNNYHVSVEKLMGGNILEVAHEYMPNVRLVGTIGLGDSQRILAGPSKLIMYGVDTAADATYVRRWFDDNTEEVKIRMASKQGVQMVDPAYFVTNDVA